MAVETAFEAWKYLQTLIAVFVLIMLRQKWDVVKHFWANQAAILQRSQAVLSNDVIDVRPDVSTVLKRPLTEIAINASFFFRELLIVRE